MTKRKPFPVPVRNYYSCKKCPAYCCTYAEIEVTQRDIERLAKHHAIGAKAAKEKFTKPDSEKKVRILRHKKDTIFDTACMFLDQKTRRCTVYESRPGVCRKFPDGTTCGYYEFLRFERAQQGDPEYIALT